MVGAVNQSSNDDKNYSARLLDLEALHCPVCTDALTSPIFQCDNGHIACSTCCNKLRNKCPACALSIGQIRCRAMERVIEGVIVPCPNAKHGCTKSFSYGKEVTHEKGCAFSLCSCPARDCNYTGSYRDLCSHFKLHKSEKGCNYRFIVGETLSVYFELTEYSSVFLKEYKERLVFVVQCFSEPHGKYVTVSCVAPSALEIGEFSCEISTVSGKYFMLVPNYFLCGTQALKLSVCVRKLNQD